jgi:hypothetical protein
VSGKAEVVLHLNCRELKTVIDTIFDRLLAASPDMTVIIRKNEDCYWEVPDDRLFDVASVQPQLDVGRLTDDWEFLQPLLDDKEQAVRLMLIHVAPLLRLVGQLQNGVCLQEPEE